MKTVLTLPFPPSVNNLFANGKCGRFTSQRYAAWQADAFEALLKQPARFDRHTRPVQVTYTFGRPDNRRRDVFNLEKAVSDFLVKHGILADDTLIERGTVQWGPAPGCWSSSSRCKQAIRLIAVKYKIVVNKPWPCYTEY